MACHNLTYITFFVAIVGHIITIIGMLDSSYETVSLLRINLTVGGRLLAHGSTMLMMMEMLNPAYRNGAPRYP